MYLKYIKHLKTACKNKKLKLRMIGSVGPEKTSLYALALKSQAKKTICFCAGVHGYEIAGPWAILEFIKTYDFKKLPKNINLIIFPCANPTGFEKNKRRNYQGLDLNRHFCDPKLKNENQILYNYVKNKKIIFFHSFHEDVDGAKFYLYAYNKKNDHSYRQILKCAEKYFTINRSKKIYRKKFSQGISYDVRDGSFEERLAKDGVPFVLCTETPGKKSLEERIKASVAIMKKIILITSKFNETQKNHH